MRTLIVLLFFAWPAQAATITYLHDGRSLNWSWGAWQYDANDRWSEVPRPVFSAWSVDYGDVAQASALSHDSISGSGYADARSVRGQWSLGSSAKFQIEVTADTPFAFSGTLSGDAHARLVRIVGPTGRYDEFRADGANGAFATAGMLRVGQVYELDVAGGANVRWRDPDVLYSGYGFRFTLVPEPGTAALVAICLAAAAAHRRRIQQRT